MKLCCLLTSAGGRARPDLELPRTSAGREGRIHRGTVPSTGALPGGGASPVHRLLSRWLIQRRSNRLEFRRTPHLLHPLRDVIVVEFGIRTTVYPEHSILVFEWQDDSSSRKCSNSTRAIAAELCAFARAARALPDLLVPIRRPLLQTMKRSLCYRRRLALTALGPGPNPRFLFSLAAASRLHRTPVFLLLRYKTRRKAGRWARPKM